MSNSSYVHLEDCEVIRLTDSAALIDVDGERIWLPLSQMAPGEADKLEAGDEHVTISVTKWIAKQKGIDV